MTTNLNRFTCKEKGCERSIANGDAIYRTSPKGELFEGKCEEHYGGVSDPIVKAIEAWNKGIR